MHFYYVSIRTWIQLGKSFQSTNRGLSSKPRLHYEFVAEFKDRDCEIRDLIGIFLHKMSFYTIEKSTFEQLIGLFLPIGTYRYCLPTHPPSQIRLLEINKVHITNKRAINEFLVAHLSVWLGFAFFFGGGVASLYQGNPTRQLTNWDSKLINFHE